MLTMDILELFIFLCYKLVIMHGVHQGTPEQSGAPDIFTQTLLSDAFPFEAADWHIDPSELDREERVFRLAHIKAILPPDNAVAEKTTHDATLENYIQFALHAAGDRETLRIFLDKALSVLETDPEEAAGLAQQVLWIWAPAAEVAGLYQQKVQLEEAAFASLLPDEYNAVRSDYDKTVLEAENGLLARMEASIGRVLSQTLSDEVTWQLQSRPKSYYSVWRKLKGEERTTAEIFDLIGIRVVIDGEEEAAIRQCYLAMNAVAGLFEVDHGRLKDYIAKPKSNGYQSLHLTLYTASGFPFELQLRTKDMHERAETDSLISHQGYDAAFKETPGKIQRVYNKAPRLYRWRDAATKLIKQHDGLTASVLQGNVLFFREDGNLYKVSDGANMLDASFRIHNRRALRTHKVTFIDGKPTRLTAAVRHGDAVRIHYAPVYPTHDGRFNSLAVIANLPKTRKAIEHGRNQANAEANRKKGRLVILGQLGHIGVQDPLALLTDEDKRTLIQRTGLPSFEKLLEVIGTGERSGKPTRVVNFIMQHYDTSDHVRPARRVTEIPNEEVLESISVPGVDKVVDDCKIAGCCSERITRGEQIVARASKIDDNVALKIHRLSCNNIRDHSDTIACSWKELDGQGS